MKKATGGQESKQAVVAMIVNAIKPDLGQWCTFELGDDGINLCWDICRVENETVCVKVATVPNLRSCIDENYDPEFELSDPQIEDIFHELLSLVTCQVYE